jgi:hypothetical protein
MMVRVGNVPGADGGWADMDEPRRSGAGGFFSCEQLPSQAAEMTIGAMIYGSVFGRHRTSPSSPKLHVRGLPEFAARHLDVAGRGPFDLAVEVAPQRRGAPPDSATATCSMASSPNPGHARVLVRLPHGREPDPIDLYGLAVALRRSWARFG